MYGLLQQVVMYNYYEWFPSGKVVFLAPTRPLVGQQIEACHTVMGFRLEDTAELQGDVPHAERATLWRDRRVFYCTPQTMQNDLQRGTCDPSKIVCLVIDGRSLRIGEYKPCQKLKINLTQQRHIAQQKTLRIVPSSAR
jgi:ERCC4-related helicase